MYARITLSEMLIVEVEEMKQAIGMVLFGDNDGLD